MKIEIVDLDNESAGEMDLDDEVFDAEVRDHLFWEVVNWQRANRRKGTASTKRRGEVRGGGRKPWRQKGTGRARHGSIRSPIWAGGGSIFGPKPKDWSYSMPKKKRRAALRSALSMKLANDQLTVVEDWELPEIKTKRAVETLERLGTPEALVVDTTEVDDSDDSVVHNKELLLSVRNLEDAKYLAAEGLNVEDILRFDHVVLSRSAAEQIQEELKS